MECNLCELRQQCLTPLPGIKVGTNPQLMVVVDCPSFEDNYVETPFYDRPFQFLKSVLMERFNEWYLTYAVKCHNTSPSPIQKKLGKICVTEWLEKEITSIRPYMILAMGKLSFNLVVRPNIQKGESVNFNVNVGKVFDRSDNIRTVGWYTPQYLFSRGKTVEREFVKVLEAIKFLGETKC